MQRAFAPPKLLCREAMGPMHGLRTIELVVSSPLSGGGHSFSHWFFEHLQTVRLGEVLAQTKKVICRIYARVLSERLSGRRRRLWTRLETSVKCYKRFSARISIFSTSMGLAPEEQRDRPRRLRRSNLNNIRTDMCNYFYVQTRGSCMRVLSPHLWRVVTVALEACRPSASVVRVITIYKDYAACVGWAQSARSARCRPPLIFAIGGASRPSRGSRG